MYKSTWLLRIPSQGPAVRATAGIFWAAGILGCWFLEESKIKHSFKSSYAWWIVLYTSLNCQAVPQHTELPACRVKDGELRRGSGGAEGFYFEGSPQGGRKAEDELSWGIAELWVQDGAAGIAVLTISSLSLAQEPKSVSWPIFPSLLLTLANTHHGFLRNPRSSIFNFQDLI